MKFNTNVKDIVDIDLHRKIPKQFINHKFIIHIGKKKVGIESEICTIKLKMINSKLNIHCAAPPNRNEIRKKMLSASHLGSLAFVSYVPRVGGCL